jgi:hypothetical protein
MPLVRLNLQHIELPDNHPKPLRHRRAPAASLSFVWTQQRPPIKRTSSPCPPESRRNRAVAQSRPDRRRC